MKPRLVHAWTSGCKLDISEETFAFHSMAHDGWNFASVPVKLRNQSVSGQILFSRGTRKWQSAAALKQKPCTRARICMEPGTGSCIVSCTQGPSTSVCWWKAGLGLHHIHPTSPLLPELKPSTCSRTFLGYQPCHVILRLTRNTRSLAL